MIKLPTEFTSVRNQGPIGGLRGYTFKVIKREGMVVLIYKFRSFKSIPTYEVAIVATDISRPLPGGGVSEDHEAMPTPEEWGTRGWTYMDLKSAEEKFQKISKKNWKNESQVGKYCLVGMTQGTGELDDD